MSIYHPSIPQAGDDPTHSQADLLDNFQKLNADFSVNHLPFTSGGNAGWHTLIQFLTTVATPGNTSGPKSALYPHTGFNTASTAAELFFKNNKQRVQLTNLKVVQTVNDPDNIDNGFKTPWGVTFNFGSALFDEHDVVFEIPFLSEPYIVLATAHGSSGVPIAVRNVTDLRFRGVSVGSSQVCYYLAIGDSILDT